VASGDIRSSALLGSGTFGVMELHVGCAMWTYAPWQGRYLPHPLSPRDRLRAYATWCNAVEGNTTFYATPALDTVKSWAEQTTSDFRFVLKLPRQITHERRTSTGTASRYGTARSSRTRDQNDSWRELSATPAPNG